jgi:hypothetical protein
MLKCKQVHVLMNAKLSLNQILFYNIQYIYILNIHEEFIIAWFGGRYHSWNKPSHFCISAAKMHRTTLDQQTQKTNCEFMFMQIDVYESFCHTVKVFILVVRMFDDFLISKNWCLETLAIFYFANGWKRISIKLVRGVFEE